MSDNIYADADTYRLVGVIANIVGIPTEEVWEAYGAFLMQFVMEKGWDQLLRAMAPDLQVLLCPLLVFL